MEFPYYKLIWEYNKEKVDEIMNNFRYNIQNEIPDSLKKMKLNKYESKYIIIKDNWQENYYLNQITDYFTEKERIRCSFKNYESPLIYWNKNKEKMIKKYGYSIIKLREGLYNETKFCNNFRISVSLTILSIFRPKTWLDISAGWGDRLISGILYGIEYYCGVDPNNNLHDYYKNIIDTMVEENKRENFVLINDAFETVELPTKVMEYDIVFSSPPFYDLEKYSDSVNDSLNKYPNEKEWHDLFLMTSINKSIKYLKKGGYLILYIHNNNYLNKKLEELKTIMEYKGWIYYYDVNNNPRGIQIWKKN
uniref:Type II methyltransferase M.TaqI-like domain-containing protein n=1 Tax=viral metagenome TaxID=1070528 RepID=A0A6C0H5R7_9ZZZZ